MSVTTLDLALHSPTPPVGRGKKDEIYAYHPSILDSEYSIS